MNSKKSGSAATKAMAAAIMSHIPEDTPLAVLRSVKRQVAQRVNILTAAEMEAKPRRSIGIKEFDTIMAMHVDKYEAPLGALPPGQMVQAMRILDSCGVTEAAAHDLARWLSEEDWFRMNPCQQRALNAIPRNLLTAMRYGDRLRAAEAKQMGDDE